MKVVRPATISVRTVVPFFFSWNTFSMFCFLLLFFWRFFVYCLRSGKRNVLENTHLFY